jgi:hypothetical protein
MNEQQLSGINVLHFHTQLLLTEGTDLDDRVRPSSSIMLHALWGATAVHAAFWFATILSTFVSHYTYVVIVCFVIISYHQYYQYIINE